jgi:hypothetical protein
MCGIFLTTDDNELVFICVPVIVFKAGRRLKTSESQKLNDIQNVYGGVLVK